MPRQTQLLMHGKTVEPLDLGVSDVAVCHHRQGGDSGGGLWAVRVG